MAHNKDQTFEDPSIVLKRHCSFLTYIQLESEFLAKMKQANVLSIILSIVGCVISTPILLPSTGFALFPGVSHSNNDIGFKPTSNQSDVSDPRVLQRLLPPVLSLNTHPEQLQKSLIDPTLALGEAKRARRKTTISDYPVSVMHT